jgi:hypothetical protein
VGLKESKALLERGELLEELLLSELLFTTAFAFVLTVDRTFHDSAPLARRKAQFEAVVALSAFGLFAKAIIASSLWLPRGGVESRSSMFSATGIAAVTRRAT